MTGFHSHSIVLITILWSNFPPSLSEPVSSKLKWVFCSWNRTSVQSSVASGWQSGHSHSSTGQSRDGTILWTISAVLLSAFVWCFRAACTLIFSFHVSSVSFLLCKYHISYSVYLGKFLFLLGRTALLGTESYLAVLLFQHLWDRLPHSALAF